MALWLWLPLVGLLLVLIGLPLMSLVYQAGSQVISIEGVRQRSWSAAKAIRLVVQSPARFGEEFAWSFALGQLSSLSVLAAAIGLAWWARSSRVIRFAAWVIMLVGLAIPGPLLALTLGGLLNQVNLPWLTSLYDRSLLLPWMTLSLRIFPWAYLLMEAIVWRIPQRNLDLATTMGANRADMLRHVLWPHVGPSVGWLWLVLLALSLGDLSASILAVPPGITTVAIRVFNLAHYGVADQLAALCLSTVGLFGLLAGLTVAFWPRDIGRGRTDR
jgi:iron(III) transport system permease protein